MWRGTIQRAKHWHGILKRSVWRFVFAFLGAASLAAFIRDEFLPPQWQARLKTLHWLPAWPWYWWAIGALACIIVAVLEDSYREERDRAAVRDQGLGSLTDAEHRGECSAPAFRITVGESGKYFRTKSLGLYRVRRILNLKVENIESQRALTGCKIQILSIAPEEYAGPFVVDEGITIAAGDHAFVPFVRYGESREGSKATSGDSFLEILPAGTGSPKPASNARHTVAIRATAIDAPALDYICEIWVDTAGRLRVSDAQRSSYAAHAPSIEIRFEKRAPYEIVEVSRGHMRSAVRIGIKNSGGGHLSNCKVSIGEIAPEPPLPGGLPIVLDGGGFTVRHDDPEKLVDIAEQFDHVTKFRFKAHHGGAFAESLMFIDDNVRRTISIKIEASEYQKTVVFQIWTDAKKALHLEQIGQSN